MGNKLIKRSSLGIVIGLVISIGTVYAAPDEIQQFKNWAEKKTNATEYEIKSSLLRAVNDQIKGLNNKSNELLSESNKKITDYGKKTAVETADNISKNEIKLKGKMGETVQEINNHSDTDFNNIIERVQLKGDEVVQSIETDYQKDLGEIKYVNIDNKTSQDEVAISNQNLKNEIELTISSIDQLKIQKESEQNQIVKDYIYKKIELLNQLVFLLRNDQ